MTRRLLIAIAVASLVAVPAHAVNVVSFRADVPDMSDAADALAMPDDPGASHDGAGIRGSTVPEAATWAILLIGFIGIGLKARARGLWMEPPADL